MFQSAVVTAKQTIIREAISVVKFHTFFTPLKCEKYLTILWSKITQKGQKRAHGTKMSYWTSHVLHTGNGNFLSQPHWSSDLKGFWWYHLCRINAINLGVNFFWFGFNGYTLICRKYLISPSLFLDFSTKMVVCTSTSTV